MQTYVRRQLTEDLCRRLRNMPAAIILGPRQCGKSTLAENYLADCPDSLYLDLERPSDLARLRDPEAFFAANASSLICLDEVQRMPELFPVLRSVIDERQRDGQFLLLGSASPDLVRESSESLAGRVAHLELSPFALSELAEEEDPAAPRDRLWLRGGFPRSYLASDDRASFEWREDFTQTFLERDLRALMPGVSTVTLRRFWTMMAHESGQTLNLSKLGGSLGVSHHTVRNYVDLLEQTFMLHTVPPYFANVKKRLVKSPKVYLRDTGILHTLLGIRTAHDLLAHPAYGASWETFVLHNLLAVAPRWQLSFYRTASGNELDFVLEQGTRRVVVECKASSAPAPAKGFWLALEDVQPTEAWIVGPVREPYPIEQGVTVAPVPAIVEALTESGAHRQSCC